MIGNILDNTTELYMIKYTFGEIFSSGGATLCKNPSDQTVKIRSFLVFGEVEHGKTRILGLDLGFFLVVVLALDLVGVFWVLGLDLGVFWILLGLDSVVFWVQCDLV